MAEVMTITVGHQNSILGDGGSTTNERRVVRPTEVLAVCKDVGYRIPVPDELLQKGVAEPNVLMLLSRTRGHAWFFPWSNTEPVVVRVGEDSGDADRPFPGFADGDSWVLSVGVKLPPSPDKKTQFAPMWMTELQVAEDSNAQAISPEDASTHETLFEKAWAIMEREVDLIDRPKAGNPGFLARHRIRGAVRDFERVLEINPTNSAAMFALGKLHQRLGDHRASLQWFVKACDLQNTHPDFLREAAQEALVLGQTADALRFAQLATRVNPGDAGLVANLAIAHLLAGDVETAARCGAQAIKMDSRDPITQNVMRVVMDVREGRRQRPHMLKDV